MEWISVKDRLPKGFFCKSYNKDLSQMVLIANTCSISIGFYDRSDYTWYIGEPASKQWIDKITHWMPLPINPHNPPEEAIDE